MKISLGSKIFTGPWGGGNNFIKNLSKYLKNNGYQVFFDLNQEDLDFILLTDPRIQSESSCFNHIDIFNYIKKVNSDAIIVHRVNECDERKNTKGVNNQIIYANNFTDYTVFISGWLKKLYSNYKEFSNSSIIYNGANKEYFFNNPKVFNKGDKFRLVTHHWSNHLNKGFEIYKLIDDKLDEEYFKNKIIFTIIGNLPKNMKFRNINHLKPLFDEELGNALRNNHAYITASMNEPGGNHQNEGINCGLPALYRDSGCMKEYCEGFGIEFNQDNLFSKLDELINNYDYYQKRTLKYNLYEKNTCTSYLNLFNQLKNNKINIINNRKWPTISKLDQFKNRVRKLIK